jgi:hypothetical protein
MCLAVVVFCSCVNRADVISHVILSILPNQRVSFEQQSPTKLASIATPKIQPPFTTPNVIVRRNTKISRDVNLGICFNFTPTVTFYIISVSVP